jgi:hypothetical protein
MTLERWSTSARTAIPEFSEALGCPDADKVSVIPTPTNAVVDLHHEVSDLAK